MSGSASSSWWQLLRAGNVFTAVSNILAGFLLVRGEWQPILPLLFLMLASAALYLSGMVLNDVFDLEIDRVERPERPLPSGRISLTMAKVVGWGLMIDGLTGAAVAAWLLGSWLPLLMAMLLATAIVGYNAFLKKTNAGPLTMGLCRALNVLLGASVVSHSPDKAAAYVFATLLGVYTVGLTLLARNEATDSSTVSIKAAGYVIQLALLALAAVAILLPPLEFGWLAAWLALLMAVRVTLFEAFLDPSSHMVQRSVSRLITAFLLIDSLVCVAAVGWPAGLLVLTLMVPTYVATRRAPMT